MLRLFHLVQFVYCWNGGSSTSWMGLQVPSHHCFCIVRSSFHSQNLLKGLTVPRSVQMTLHFSLHSDAAMLLWYYRRLLSLSGFHTLLPWTRVFVLKCKCLPQEVWQEIYHADCWGAFRHWSCLHHCCVASQCAYHWPMSSGGGSRLCFGGCDTVQFRDGSRPPPRSTESDLPGVALRTSAILVRH